MAFLAQFGCGWGEIQLEQQQNTRHQRTDQRPPYLRAGRLYGRRSRTDSFSHSGWSLFGTASISPQQLANGLSKHCHNWFPILSCLVHILLGFFINLVYFLVVFTPLEYGLVGLSEEAAIDQHGEKAIEVFSFFSNLTNDFFSFVFFE